jgi:hypothetical protein
MLVLSLKPTEARPSLVRHYPAPQSTPPQPLLLFSKQQSPKLVSAPLPTHSATMSDDSSTSSADEVKEETPEEEEVTDLSNRLVCVKLLSDKNLSIA